MCSMHRCVCVCVCVYVCVWCTCVCMCMVTVCMCVVRLGTCRFKDMKCYTVNMILCYYAIVCMHVCHYKIVKQQCAYSPEILLCSCPGQ